VSRFRGFEQRRRISAETASLVLRMVNRQSLASLFGSSRPRIPLSSLSHTISTIVRETYTLPTEDI